MWSRSYGHRRGTMRSSSIYYGPAVCRKHESFSRRLQPVGLGQPFGQPLFRKTPKRLKNAPSRIAASGTGVLKILKGLWCRGTESNCRQQPFQRRPFFLALRKQERFSKSLCVGQPNGQPVDFQRPPRLLGRFHDLGKDCDLTGSLNVNAKLDGFPHSVCGEYGPMQVLPQSKTSAVTQGEAVITRGRTQEAGAQGEILVKRNHREP